MEAATVQRHQELLPCVTKNRPAGWVDLRGYGLRRRSGLLHRPAPALFAQPIAFALDGDDVAVVKQAIEDGGGHHRVAEHGVPFADRPVGRHQHGAALVATAHQLEEQLGDVGRERQIAEFVDDQELGLAVTGEPLVQADVLMRLGDEATSGELADLRLVDRRLGRAVEAGLI